MIAGSWQNSSSSFGSMPDGSMIDLDGGFVMGGTPSGSLFNSTEISFSSVMSPVVSSRKTGVKRQGSECDCIVSDSVFKRPRNISSRHADKVFSCKNFKSYLQYFGAVCLIENFFNCGHVLYFFKTNAKCFNKFTLKIDCI